MKKIYDKNLERCYDIRHEEAEGASALDAIDMSDVLIPQLIREISRLEGENEILENKYSELYEVVDDMIYDFSTGYSDELKQILINTVVDYFGVKDME